MPPAPPGQRAQPRQALPQAVQGQRQLSAQSTRAIGQAAKLYGYDPVTFGNAIAGAAARYGVNPNLLVGLASKESSLDPSPTRGNHGGLFQIGSARAKDLAVTTKNVGDFETQIPKVAAALSNSLTAFHGNQELAVASWTLGVGKTQKLFEQGGLQAVRNALLDRSHPGYGRVGPKYIDFVKSYLGP